MAEADYKKIYYIPELESKLDYINLNYRKDDPAIRMQVNDALILIDNEIQNELNSVGRNHFEYLDKLTLRSFDSVTYANSRLFLEKLKQFYIARYNKADQLKEKVIRDMTITAAQEKEFEKFKLAYTNDAISDPGEETPQKPTALLKRTVGLYKKFFPFIKNLNRCTS